MLGSCGQLDRHQVERRQDVAIGRIGGCGQRHPVARLEGGKEGKQKGARRAGSDDDARRVEGDAIAPQVMRGDRLAKCRQAERIGIAERLAPKRLPRGGKHGGRGGRRWLTDLEVEDVIASGSPLVGSPQDVHSDEWRDLAALGDLEGHDVSGQAGET
jgi:hypothetical protein